MPRGLRPAPTAAHRAGRSRSGLSGPIAEQRPVLLAFGLLAGAALPTQAAVNAQLRDDLDAPFGAAAISFVVAAAAMGAVLLAGSALRRCGRRGRVGGLSTMPVWGWLGAAVGAAYVTSMLVAVPSIGAASAIALTVAGQQLGSAAADHRGLLRLPRRSVTRPRLLGVALLVVGAALVQLG